MSKDIKSIAAKVAAELKKAFTPEDVKFFSDYKAKLNASITPPAVTLATVNTDKGVLSYDGELKEGAVVTIDGNPAPDGDYKLEDGTVVSVTGGTVSKVTKAETPVESPEMMAKMAAHKKELEEAFDVKLKKETDSLKAETKELKDQIKVLFDFVDKIVTAPVDTTSKKEDWRNKPYEQMSNYEKLQYNRENKK
jgi:hypothetical protein